MNQAAIDSVRSGKQREARASWWGFDPAESTNALQAAIHSGAATVIVDKQAGPWIVDRIELAGDQEVRFEPGTIVLAKKGAFRGTSDSLFSAWNQKNVRLVGQGAILQMHRADYASPDYKKGEWRHVLSIRGCTGVTVSGLTLAESGGDGIYLGAGRHGEPNKDITIRDVICDRNYRQGISVISAENLLIENCVLKNTAGTAPAAGIDFEPNHPRESLVNCVMRNCLMEDNQGYGLHIYARPLDGTSPPMSMRIEACNTRGTNARSLSIVTSCGPKGPVRGKIEVVGCRFEDVGKAGINIGSKPPEGAALRFADCVIADSACPPPATPPIVFSARPGDLQGPGGVEFTNFVIRERGERPVMRFHDAVGLHVTDLRGTLTIERDGKRIQQPLTQEMVDQWIPFDPISLLPRVPFDLKRLRPSSKASTPQKAIPVHLLRDEALYALCAQAGQKVSFRMRYQAIGRAVAKPISAAVCDAAGKTISKVALEVGKEAEGSFTAAQTGVYQIACRPEKHVVRLVNCSHPVCMVANNARFHFVHTQGELYFRVPAGTKEFGVRVMGEGEGERVSATLIDPAGKTVWQRADVSAVQSYDGKPATEGIWRIRLAKPSSGAFEDHHLELRGIPPIVAFTAEGLLQED